MRIQPTKLLIPLTYGLVAGFVITLSKIKLSFIPAIIITAVSTLVACITLAPSVTFRECKKIKLNHVLYFCIIGISGIYYSNVWYFKSIQYTTVINAALINALCPIVTLLATSTLRQKLPRKKLALAMALSFFGVCCIITQGKIPDLDKVSYLGELYAFGSIVAWVLYGIFISRLNSTFSSTFVTFAANFAGLLFLAPAMYRLGYPLSAIEPYQWLTLIFIGIAGSGIGFTIYNYSLQNIGPNLTTLIAFGIKSISVFVFAFFLLSDPISFWDLAGAASVLTGLYLALW